MRVARRVRRAGRGNPPGAILAGRPGPTQQLGRGRPVQEDVVLDDPHGQAGPAAGQAGQVGPVGGVPADAGQSDVGLDADQDVGAGGQHRRDPGHAGKVPVHDPQPVGGEHVGLLGQHPVQQRLFGLTLGPGLVPTGRATHHAQGGAGERVGDVQVPNLRVAGLGRPAVPNAARLARGVGHPGHGAVDRAEPQPAAHIDPGQGRVSVLGPDSGQHLPLQLLQRRLADRRPPRRQHRARRHRVRPPPRHLGQLPEQRGEHLAGVGVGHHGHQQHRPDRARHAHLPPRHRLDLPGRADPGGYPLDGLRPTAAVQLLLRDPEPGMITRAALGLHPPIPAQHHGRHHHHLAPGHRTTGRDRLGPRDQQRRPAVPARSRPHGPDQRRHRDGHHHRLGSRLIPTGDLHTGDRGPGRDRVERHAEAPGRRSALDTGSSTGSLHLHPARHAEHTDHSGPLTSPTSLNVTADEQPRTEAETAHLPGIGRRPHRERSFRRCPRTHPHHRQRRHRGGAVRGIQAV